MKIIRRDGDAHQAPSRMSTSTSTSTSDFLNVAKEEAEASLSANGPSDRLVQAAVKSIPGMVMEKFHNVGGGKIPHRFYELTGRGTG